MISSILIPLFLFPVLTVGIGYAFVEVADQASREASRIMILGGADSPDVVQRLKQAKNLRIVADTSGLCRSDFEQANSRRRWILPPGFQTDVETRLASGGEDLYFFRRLEVDAQRDSDRRSS